MELEKLSMHEGYKKFCSKYPLKKLSMPKSDLVWCYYDINSKKENIVIFLHGVCGTAGCYFYQLDNLSTLGFRVISLQYPCYNNLKDWMKNMCNILEYLNIKKAHFFASDLGGYLIQLYAKLYPSKVESLILCNSYRKTDNFASIASLRSIYGKFYSFLPHVLLKKIILENYIYLNYEHVDLKEMNSLEFMSNEIDLISASDLGGRISLQLSSDNIDKIYMNDKCITILQTLNNIYPDSLNDDMKKAYPLAKYAIMKSGGNFPYLSRHEEVNMYILVHLRNNCNTNFIKQQITTMSTINLNKYKKEQTNQYNHEHKYYDKGSCKINYKKDHNEYYTNPDEQKNKDSYNEHYTNDYIHKQHFSNNKINKNSKENYMPHDIKYDTSKNTYQDITDDDLSYKYSNYNSSENMNDYINDKISKIQNMENNYSESNTNDKNFYQPKIYSYNQNKQYNYIKDNYSNNNNNNNYNNDELDDGIYNINPNDNVNYQNEYYNRIASSSDEQHYEKMNNQYKFKSANNDNNTSQSSKQNIQSSYESYNNNSINYEEKNINPNDSNYRNSNFDNKDIYCQF